MTTDKLTLPDLLPACRQLLADLGKLTGQIPQGEAGRVVWEASESLQRLQRLLATRAAAIPTDPVLEDMLAAAAEVGAEAARTARPDVPDVEPLAFEPGPDKHLDAERRAIRADNPPVPRWFRDQHSTVVKGDRPEPLPAKPAGSEAIPSGSAALEYLGREVTERVEFLTQSEVDITSLQGTELILFLATTNRDLAGLMADESHW